MPLPLAEPQCHLHWPSGIFIDEFNHICSYGSASQMHFLLQEAFVSSFLADRFAKTSPNTGQSRADFGGVMSSDVIDELESRLDELTESVGKLPYYHQRTTSEKSRSATVSTIKLRHEFVVIVRDFDKSGYLDNAFGKDCVDHPRINPDEKLYDLLHIPNLWPLNPDDWSEEITFSLMEVFHDLVARPRTFVRYHDYADCGPHYSDFASEPGRALYSNKVNKLLSRYQHRFRLSTVSEDKGRLVILSDIAREDLVGTSVEKSDKHTNHVRHAISLFRSRSASREDKQSAIVTLAKIMEQDRNLIQKAGLSSKDENALFEIANKFDLRHGNHRQLSNYSDEFLDWIFWWYLATVDLTRSLSDRALSDGNPLNQRKS